MDRRVFLQSFALSAAARSARAADRPWEWRVYGGDQEATRYAPLSRIDKSNVAGLRPIWTHHAGDAIERPATTIECTPIVVDGVLYLTTAQLKVQALEAATGRLLWSWDPFEGSRDRRARGVNRGVTYWQDGSDERIFMSARSEYFALNAKTGKVVESFGQGGAFDLNADGDFDMPGASLRCTTPGAVYGDLLIIGSAGGEGPAPTPPAHIRAYDCRTGKRRWIFHTIPQPGEPFAERWTSRSRAATGAANNWGGMSVDERRGLVFVSTGSAAFDFYGGERPGDNLFANSVLCLKAETGERLWHFQTVRHDIWDYDLPCQPILLTVVHNGVPVDAVAQIGKTGFVYLLDRETGRPLFPIVDKPVSVEGVEGEIPFPTQPVPLKPPPFARQSFYEGDVNDLTPEIHREMLARYRRARAGEMFLPPSREGTIIFPGFHGGGLWGGGSWDPVRRRLFVNSNEIPWLMTLVDAPAGAGYRYMHLGYHRFETDDHWPGIKPPWGQLTALDLDRGEIDWQVPLGEHPEWTAKGASPTGTENIGGSIATAGGLVFIAATKDERMRAFDSDTGDVLWETQLPAGGYATPCTFEAGGKQLVVIACGGAGKNRTKSGDAFVAFGL